MKRLQLAGKNKTTAAFEPDLKQAEKILLEMLAIPGKSCQERQVAEYITTRLRRAGIPRGAIQCDTAHRRSPYGGEQGNLVCRLPGTVSAPPRMLSAHIDTVPLCAGARPVVRRGLVVPAEKTTALGGDDRSGATAVLSAALEIVRRRLPHPPLVFLWTVQEELGLWGARHANLALLGKPKLAFNFDGGSPEHVTIGATGGYRMQIRIRGIASHAGVAPDRGVSAIAVASLAIAELHREGWHGQVVKDGRTGTSNVGVIHGGEATNVVTPEVEVHAEARSHDPAFRRRIVAAIERAFRGAARSVRNTAGEQGSVEISGRLDYESFRLKETEPSVAAAQAAVRAVGGEPLLAISNGGLDANWLTARGIPAVTLGAGVANAHTPEERLDLSQFRQACRIALHLATTRL
jgi:tripeptide aminopeptidase